ncbi:MAG: DUF192 domain-containing protein [Bacilli bacterium]|nr:DUF192 domain-containing protein [Bacilli bacterium]
MEIKIYNTFSNRLIGLMFIKNKINYGVCFPKCKSIHTFFMRQNIDVVATDKNNQIIKIYKNVKPYHFVFAPNNTYYIYELPYNTSNIEKIIKETQF